MALALESTERMPFKGSVVVLDISPKTHKPETMGESDVSQSERVHYGDSRDNLSQEYKEVSDDSLKPEEKAVRKIAAAVENSGHTFVVNILSPVAVTAPVPGAKTAAWKFSETMDLLGESLLQIERDPTKPVHLIEITSEGNRQPVEEPKISPSRFAEVLKNTLRFVRFTEFNRLRTLVYQPTPAQRLATQARMKVLGVSYALSVIDQRLEAISRNAAEVDNCIVDGGSIVKGHPIFDIDINKVRMTPFAQSLS